MIVVSDTSPISNLIQVGRLDLLHEVFGEVLIPPKVQEEILELRNFGIDLKAFLASDWYADQGKRTRVGFVGRFRDRRTSGNGWFLGKRQVFDKDQKGLRGVVFPRRV